jgi:hypothetical protein
MFVYLCSGWQYLTIEAFFQSVESLLPIGRQVFHDSPGLREWPGVQPEAMELACLNPMKYAGTFQHLEMFRDRCGREAEGSRTLGHGAIGSRHLREDSTSGRIGQRMEYAI